MKRLGFYREFAGKNSDMMLLLKTCEISKHEFLERIEIAAVVGAPALYDKLPPARKLAPDRKKAID